MAERCQVCQQVHENVEMCLAVSMDKRLFDLTVGYVDWDQLPPNYLNLILIPVKEIPGMYFSPIRLA